MTDEHTRRADADRRTGPAALTFTFDDRPISARGGDTIGASLMRAGILTLRRSRSIQPRGLYCGIGVCNDCLVNVDGLVNVRACVTPAVERTIVRSQDRPMARRSGGAAEGQP